MLNLVSYIHHEEMHKKFQVSALHQGEKGACGLSVYMYTGDGGAVPVWLKSGDLDV